MTTRQISETIEDIYGFETSESFISDVTDKILPQIEDWQNRPLDEVYPILYIDAIHYSVRDNGVIRKLDAYVILGINTEKSWCQRCINHLCRWFNRNQRSDRSSFSKDGIPALYCTPGKKHVEICPG